MLQVFPVVVNAHPSHAAKPSVEGRSYGAAAAVSITLRDIVGTQYCDDFIPDYESGRYA
jgi:hypothetical protein